MRVCKLCARETANKWYHNNQERHHINTKAWYQANKDYFKGRYEYNQDTAFAKSLFRKYKMTVQEYDALLDIQGGGCAICHQVCPSGRRLNVDHDHQCCPGGKNTTTCGLCVRALLCMNCNQALGKLHDDVELVSRALGYLTEWHAARTARLG